MTDLLGATITVGCLVATPKYRQSTNDYVTKVLKVGRATITVEVPAIYTRQDVNGNWYYPTKVVRRRSWQFFRVSEQIEANRRMFPENFV